MCTRVATDRDKRKCLQILVINVPLDSVLYTLHIAELDKWACGNSGRTKIQFILVIGSNTKL